MNRTVIIWGFDRHRNLVLWLFTIIEIIYFLFSCVNINRGLWRAKLDSSSSPQPHSPWPILPACHNLTPDWRHITLRFRSFHPLISSADSALKFHVANRTHARQNHLLNALYSYRSVQKLTDKQAVVNWKVTPKYLFYPISFVMFRWSSWFSNANRLDVINVLV